MLRFPLAFALAAFAAGAALAAPSANGPKARLTMTQARAIALRAAPGRVISGEYEKEGGGWRYSFDIQQRGHVQEIGVDAATGRIVENKSEGKVDHD
ncbi:MAG: hypothetical protein QOH86_1345 [Sphingomonadales bacterium]|jgi:uncharacterized membrane protein YkoI|nr:hypothetical protein [Sphingomonadales bacterium]